METPPTVLTNEPLDTPTAAPNVPLDTPLSNNDHGSLPAPPTKPPSHKRMPRADLPDRILVSDDVELWSLVELGRTLNLAATTLRRWLEVLAVPVLGIHTRSYLNVHTFRHALRLATQVGAPSLGLPGSSLRARLAKSPKGMEAGVVDRLDLPTLRRLLEQDQAMDLHQAVVDCLAASRLRKALDRIAKRRERTSVDAILALEKRRAASRKLRRQEQGRRSWVVARQRRATSPPDSQEDFGPSGGDEVASAPKFP